MTACVICASRSKKREIETGHVCRACENALNQDLSQILDLVALAAVMPPAMAATGNGGPRPVPASKPPLDVARIDPEMTLVLADKTDPSSGEPLLVLLESWERAIREDRGMSRYGPATVSRSTPAVTDALPGTAVTLMGVIGFLRSSVAWMCETPDFAVEQLADQVRRALATLRRYDPMLEHPSAWKLPCPGDYDDDVCGWTLRVEYGLDANLHDDIGCPQCRSVWTPLRLLLVALEDERVEVWHYADTIKDALNIPARTLRWWAQTGRVERRGSQYNVGQAYRLRNKEQTA